MTFDKTSYMYISDIKPAECDNVEIRTSYKDSLVSAADIVPKKVGIESVSVSRQGPLSIYTDRDYVFTYNITFTDPVGRIISISCSMMLPTGVRVLGWVSVILLMNMCSNSWRVISTPMSPVGSRILLMDCLSQTMESKGRNILLW